MITIIKVKAVYYLYGFNFLFLLNLFAKLFDNLNRFGGILLITKGEIVSVDRSRNRCVVRLPLFETAGSSERVEVEALFSIVPGLYNNIFERDIVFVAFEENALEKPVVIGKLYRGADVERKAPGGAGIFDTLQVNSSATLPATTVFSYSNKEHNEYENLKTPKKIADYIKWLEKLFKNMFRQVDENFRCFKAWTQWQLKSENVEVDDGDLDVLKGNLSIPCQYQEENANCEICGKKCVLKTNNKKERTYTKIDTSKQYDDI